MADPILAIQTPDLDAATRLSGHDLRLRPVRATDRDVIVRQRRDMFAANGHPAEVVEPMAEAFAVWLEPRLADGRYFGWIAEAADGLAVAGLGMMAMDWPPHPRHPRQDRRGLITNVWVEPDWRGMGVAKTLMRRATAEGFGLDLDLLVLHASPMGRPLYEALGWIPSSEMMLPLKRG